MTLAEFTTFAALLRTFYPKEQLLPTPEAVKAWHRMLEDIDINVLNAALQKWVATEKWPPTVAEMRTACIEATEGKLPGWGEAWMEVSEAVRRYGWCRPNEALDSLSPATRRAAQWIGWQQICESENPEAIRAQFRQVYEISQTRDAEARQLPPTLRDTLEKIGAGSIGVLPEGRQPQ